jgi:CheY-like chemotaxis protein
MNDFAQEPDASETVTVYFVDDGQDSIDEQYNIATELPEVETNDHNRFDEPWQLYRKLSELYHDKIAAGEPFRAVVVMDVNAASWAEMEDFGLTREDTDGGHISGIAFAQRVLRAENDEKYGQYAAIPIIFLTSWTEDRLVADRVQALVEQFNAPTRLVSKSEPDEYRTILTEVVDKVLKNDQRRTGNAPEKPPADRFSASEVRILTRKTSKIETGTADTSPRERFIDALVRYWRLEPAMKFKMLGVDPADAARLTAALRGEEKPLTRDLHDRIACLDDIRVKLSDIFDGAPSRDAKRDMENNWLRAPVDDLKGMAAVQLIQSGTMEDLLTFKGLVYRKCNIW